MKECLLRVYSRLDWRSLGRLTGLSKHIYLTSADRSCRQVSRQPTHTRALDADRSRKRYCTAGCFNLWRSRAGERVFLPPSITLNRLKERPPGPIFSAKSVSRVVTQSPTAALPREKTLMIRMIPAPPPRTENPVSFRSPSDCPQITPVPHAQ